MNRKSATADPCCPRFEPDLWDGKTHVWDGKPFIKDIIPQLLHMPLPRSLNRTITRMWGQAQQAQAAPDLKDFLLLAYDPTPWRSELYMAVTGEVSGAENVQLSGTFLSKVFDGPYSAVPKWIAEMERHVAAAGKQTQKHFFYFTTCPKCAKTYGHNYVVAFAQVE